MASTLRHRRLLELPLEDAVEDEDITSIFRNVGSLMMTTTTTMTMEGQSRRPYYFWRMIRRKDFGRRKLLRWAFRVLWIVGLVRLYLSLERRIPDPAWRGVLYGPFSYALIQYWQPAPIRESPRPFVMSRNNTFVIHLDSDTQRWAQFQENNPDLECQIFPATYLDPSIYYQQTIKRRYHQRWWLRSRPAPIISWENSSSSSNNMEFWMEHYPTVPYFLSKGYRGTASVSISHLRLWARLAYPTPDQEDLDYLFVFEDDVRISKKLRRNKEVLAPADVDVVFLMKTATRTVPVGNHEMPLTRVFEGYGALGYVITKAAARTALDRIRFNLYHPIDIALMDLAVQWLRIYLPIDHWPVVWHTQGGNPTRRLNDK